MDIETQLNLVFWLLGILLALLFGFCIGLALNTIDHHHGH